MELKFQYKSLVESLRLLASSYENQKNSLPDFVIVKDEVIAIFEDVFLLLPQLIEAELVDKQAIASIVRCFNLMTFAARNSDVNAINNDIWEKVRHLAAQALIDMRETKDKPDLTHIEWID